MSAFEQFGISIDLLKESYKYVVGVKQGNCSLWVVQNSKVRQNERVLKLIERL